MGSTPSQHWEGGVRQGRWVASYSGYTQIQWNLSNTGTLGLIKSVLIKEVSSFQGANTVEHLSNTDRLGPIKSREVSHLRG